MFSLALALPARPWYTNCGQVRQPGLVGGEAVRARFSFDPSHEEDPQHTIPPFRVFRPAPSSPAGFLALFRSVLVRTTIGNGSSLVVVVLVSIFLRPFAPAIITRLRSRAAECFRFFFPGLACATTDALTAAAVRFFGLVLAQHELRPLTRGNSPMFSAHHFESRSVTNHPTSPVRPPFPVLCGFRLFLSFADLASFFESSLANLPGRIVFTLVTDRRSRTRLLQTPPRSDALTLCFLFFHGLTMQDLHLL
jgi:hypothetical protein